MKIQVNEIETREDLVKYLEEFRLSLHSNSEEWDNKDLASFLEGMSAWVADMDGYFSNIGEQCPEKPEWRTFAQILAASKVYE